MKTTSIAAAFGFGFFGYNIRLATVNDTGFKDQFAAGHPGALPHVPHEQLQEARDQFGPQKSTRRALFACAHREDDQPDPCAGRF
jgi:hypothetical protein